jgi:hypothetical protein
MIKYTWSYNGSILQFDGANSPTPCFIKRKYSNLISSVGETNDLKLTFQTTLQKIFNGPQKLVFLSMPDLSFLEDSKPTQWLHESHVRVTHCSEDHAVCMSVVSEIFLSRGSPPFHYP